MIPRLEGIREQLTAATPGPWEESYGDVVQSVELTIRTGEHEHQRVGIVPGVYVRPHDAVFIAAAPSNVAALLAAIDAVTALHFMAHTAVETWAAGYPYSGDHCAHDGAHWPCPTVTAITTALKENTMTTTELQTWNAEDQPDPLEPCVGNPAYEAHIEKVISTALGPGKFSYLQTNLAIILDREQREKEGYRKPRTITAVAELDALAVGSVVLSEAYSFLGGIKVAFQLWDDGLWHRGRRSGDTHPDNFLPVTVLHEATA